MIFPCTSLFAYCGLFCRRHVTSTSEDRHQVTPPKQNKNQTEPGMSMFLYMWSEGRETDRSFTG